MERVRETLRRIQTEKVGRNPLDPFDFLIEFVIYRILIDLIKVGIKIEWHLMTKFKLTRYGNQCFNDLTFHNWLIVYRIY